MGYTKPRSHSWTWDNHSRLATTYKGAYRGASCWDSQIITAARDHHFLWDLNSLIPHRRLIFSSLESSLSLTWFNLIHQSSMYFTIKSDASSKRLWSRSAVKKSSNQVGTEVRVTTNLSLADVESHQYFNLTSPFTHPSLRYLSLHFNLFIDFVCTQLANMMQHPYVVEVKVSREWVQVELKASEMWL